ncbi:hypothetical protein [Luteococcus peritonei]|uniref:Uncharacterized protein n=1 Tax=Luteococcus peritonei TaxID=88874 RepID=A0ABW4RTH8_9ACTN
MIIAIAAIATLWIAAALVIAFAGRSSADVERALASTEQIRAWDEFDTVRAAWASEDADSRQIA